MSKLHCEYWFYSNYYKDGDEPFFVCEMENIPALNHTIWIDKCTPILLKIAELKIPYRSSQARIDNIIRELEYKNNSYRENIYVQILMMGENWD